MAATATPGTVTKKKLSIAQAADQWEKARRAIDKNKALLEEAAPILIAHLEKTGRDSYKGRIGLVHSAGRLILDQAKVREYLGKKLGQFQKRTEPSVSLTLLKKE